MTISDRKLAANRANALLSTGPRTPEGKAKSSKNATRHGMLAKTIVLEGESEERFQELLLSLIAEFHPRTPAENAVIETMAAANWGLMRTWGMRKAGMDQEMFRVATLAPGAPPSVRASAAHRTLADHSRSLDLLERYETACDRQFARAFALLCKIRDRQTETPQFFQAAPASDSKATFNDPPPNPNFTNEPTPTAPSTPSTTPQNQPSEVAQASACGPEPTSLPDFTNEPTRPQNQPRRSRRGPQLKAVPVAQPVSADCQREASQQEPSTQVIPEPNFTNEPTISPLNRAARPPARSCPSLVIKSMGTDHSVPTSKRTDAQPGLAVDGTE
jgi:hypothetical protein